MSPPLRSLCGYDGTLNSPQTQYVRDNAIVEKLELTLIETAILRAVCDPLYPHLEDTVLDNQGQEKVS